MEVSKHRRDRRRELFRRKPATEIEFTSVKDAVSRVCTEPPSLKDDGKYIKIHQIKNGKYKVEYTDARNITQDSSSLLNDFILEIETSKSKYAKYLKQSIILKAIKEKLKLHIQNFQSKEENNAKPILIKVSKLKEMGSSVKEEINFKSKLKDDLDKHRTGIKHILGNDIKEQEALWEIFKKNYKKYPPRSEATDNSCPKYIRYGISQFLNEIEKEVMDQIPNKLIKSPDKLLVYFQEKLKSETTKTPQQYVLSKLEKQAYVWREMRNIDKYKYFSFKDVWLYTIDGSKQEYGPYIFENEPGYTVATHTALLKVFKEAKHNEPLSIWYQSLHNELSKALKPSQGSSLLVKYKRLCVGCHSSMNSQFVGVRQFGVDTQDQSEEGIADLEKRTELGKVPFELKAEKTMVVDYSNVTGEQLVKVIELLSIKLEEYVKKEENPALRLIAYAWFVREAGIRHVFEDGNGRTSVMALYSMITADPALPPCLLFNPNIFDANGPEKLFFRILEGMNNFSQVTQGKGMVRNDENDISLRLKDFIPNESVVGLDTLVKEGKNVIAGKPWDYFHKKFGLNEDDILSVCS